MSLFSSSAEIVSLLTDIKYLLAYFMLGDCIYGVYSGVVTALGKQGRASIFTIISFWMIGFPGSLIYINLYQVDLFSLWIGMAIAITFIVGFYYQMIVGCDWY